MISVVIPTLNDEAVIGRALLSLVSAAVSGLVREVIVADAGSTDATLEIADDAGCTILKLEGSSETRIRSAAESAKGDWMMILEPRVQLLPGWEAPVRAHIESGTGKAAFAPLLDPDAGFIGRLAGAFSGPGSARVVLVTREACAAGDIKPSRRLGASAILLRG
jgi:glycosyltransferase involved in cell wall biosynthesis